jgi:hypothetical protein
MFFQKSVVLLNKNFKMKCNSYKLPGSGLNRLGYLGNKIVIKLVQTIAFERITDIISYLSKTNFERTLLSEEQPCPINCCGQNS